MIYVNQWFKKVSKKKYINKKSFEKKFLRFQRESIILAKDIGTGLSLPVLSGEEVSSASRVLYDLSLEIPK